MTFGFSQSVYPVSEENASGEGYIFEVYVELLFGELDREVIITLKDEDGSAIGNKIKVSM